MGKNEKIKYAQHHQKEKTLADCGFEINFYIVLE